MADSGSGKRIAQITISRCMRTGRDFGIRWEKTGSDEWIATWAFKIPTTQKDNDNNQQKEQQLSGSFRFHESYPGCPHCGGGINLKCVRCGRIYCHDKEKGIRTKCPWCGLEGEIDMTPERGGGGRKIYIPGKGDR